MSLLLVPSFSLPPLDFYCFVRFTHPSIHPSHSLLYRLFYPPHTSPNGTLSSSSSECINRKKKQAIRRKGKLQAHQIGNEMKKKTNKQKERKNRTLTNEMDDGATGGSGSFFFFYFIFIHSFIDYACTTSQGLGVGVWGGRQIGIANSKKILSSHFVCSFYSFPCLGARKGGRDERGL